MIAMTCDRGMIENRIKLAALERMPEGRSAIAAAVSVKAWHWRNRFAFHPKGSFRKRFP